MIVGCVVNNAVEITSLQKNFGSVSALQGVDLSIRQGEFFGLLGPNGAGKTTLISALFGLVHPDVGSISVFGHNFPAKKLAAKKMMGLCPQEINMHNFIPIEKILNFQGGFYGLSPTQSAQRAEVLLKKFGLWEKRRGGRNQLSGGMQRRLLIARAMMGSPRLLVLDEPTAGVDVELRHEMWEMLRALNQSGTTILLTTHYIEEAELLCQRVAVMNMGKIVACDTPQALIAQSKPTQNRKFVRQGSLEEVFINLTEKKSS